MIKSKVSMPYVVKIELTDFICGDADCDRFATQTMSLERPISGFG